MKKVKIVRLLTIFTLIIVFTGLITACGGEKIETQEQEISAAFVGDVQLNPHPANLEGKTVVLRWNGKPNGDKLLTQIGDLLIKNVKDVKIIKLWEIDPVTGVSSESLETSAQFAEKIAALEPDLVIASQCD